MEYDEFDEEYGGIEVGCECEICVMMRRNPKPRNREERRRQRKELGLTQKSGYLFHMGVSFVALEENEEFENNTEEIFMKSDT